MDDNRKKIIIKEILYWKESRLLPEQYCDYLLALYTEGNHAEGSKKAKTVKQPIHLGYFILSLIPLFVFLLYFTELSFDLQMALAILGLITGMGTTYYFFRKGIQFQISLVITALVLLHISVECTAHYFSTVSMALYITVLLNCFLWVLLGRKLKLLYFIVSGFLGMAVLLVSIFL